MSATAIERGIGLAASVSTPVLTVENHDEAYYCWRHARLRDQHLVHVDAHHDLWWRASRDPITVANFICPAIREGIIRSVTWVVPTPSFADRSSRAAIRRLLARLARQYPDSARLRAREDCFTLTLAGVDVRVCAIEDLPRFEGTVLLDVDTDYFLIPKVRYGGWDCHADKPWCWPEELLSRIEDTGVPVSMATIAYSVNGGYTPPRWKFLADEFSARLQRRAAGAYELLRAGDEAESGGAIEQAERLYRQSARELPASAAPWFRLACLHADNARVEQARQLYGEAVRLDPSYGGPYASMGFPYFWAGRPEAAEREHRRMQVLDPHNAQALCGLGFLDAERGLPDAALRRFREALQRDARLIDAWRGLGNVLSRLGRDQEAAAAYERYIQLSLEGVRPIAALCASSPQRFLLDPQLGTVQADLAALLMRQGRHSEAESLLRMSLASRDAVDVRCRLARMLAGKGALRAAWTHLAAALRMSLGRDSKSPD